MELLVVQLPRGGTAIVGMDSTTNIPFTNHSGLYGTLFQYGVKDLAGKVVLPHQGRTFLSAVYDYLFLNGYRVRWLSSINSDTFLREA